MKTSSRSFFTLAVAAAVALAIPAETAWSAPDTAPIIDGTRAPATDYPAVALVSLPDSLCTGTLIAPHHVLTAAHCFFDDRNRQITNIGEIAAVVNNVRYPAKSFTVHPAYVSRSAACIDGETDAAIVELQSDVPVTPIALQRVPASIGQRLLLVGFGTLGTGASGENGQLPPDGSLEFGFTTIERIPSSLYVEWTFNRGESNTASGDSGGPAFTDIDGARVINSITCGGTGRAGFNTTSTNTRADFIAPWVDSVVGTTPANVPAGFIGLGSLTTGQNQGFTYTVQTSGTAPVAVAATNLPPGLALNGNVLSGTPTVAGTYMVSLSASNSAGSASGLLEIVVTPFDPSTALTLTRAVVDFRPVATDLLALGGTVVVGSNFNPKGVQVRVQIGELVSTFTLNRQGFAQRRGGFDFVRLNGKLSGGVFVDQSVRFAVGLGDQRSLFKKLDQLFPIDTSGLPADFRVNLPVEIQVGGVTYSSTIALGKRGRGDRWVPLS